eukprot:403375503
MELNDPLHLKAYGTKNDYTQKDQVRYPHNQNGVVDEWKALMDQRLRRHQHDQKIMAEVKKQDQNMYKNELDAVRTVHDQQKYLERVTKQQEHTENQDRMRVLQEYNLLKKTEDNELKNYLSSTNKQILTENNQKRQDEVMKNIMDDQERLKRLKITNEDELRRKLLEKQDFKDSQNKFLEYRGKLKENERQEEKQMHVEYIQQCEQNGRLQDQKDRMYKQFFANFESNLNQRAKFYLDKILEEEIKKDMMMRNWETNGNDPVFKQMSEERIRAEVERRLKDAGEIKEFNKFMIEQHERDRERQTEIAKMELEYRKVKEEGFRREEGARKKEEKQNQKLYGQTLDFQSNIHQKMRFNYGSMTEQEKRMNKMDLKSYKDGDTTIHSMIPGISNIQSVGSSPLIRKGVNINLTQNINGGSTQSGSGLGQNNLLSQSISGGQTMGELLNQSIHSARGLSRQGLARNVSTGALLSLNPGKYGLHDQHPIKESMIQKRVNLHIDADPEVMRQSFEQKKQGTVGYYNPITNPVPNYSQNPYIARERTKAHQLMNSQSRAVLAQAGNNILM